MKYVAIIVSGLLLTLARLTFDGHDASIEGTYEAVAHVWCGFLLALVVVPGVSKTVRWTSGLTLAIASLVELVMFLVR